MGSGASTGRAGVLPGALILFASAQPVPAAIRWWENPSGGSFGTPSNWRDAAVPGAADTAVFHLGGAYSVTLPSNVTNDSAVVYNGDVGLDLSGRTYSLRPHLSGTEFGGLSVARTPGSTAALSVGNGTLRIDGARIGTHEHDKPGGGSGTLNVVEGGILRADLNPLSTKLSVGQNGTGTLNVRAGGNVMTNYLEVATGLSSGSSSMGRVTVSGAGSELTATSDVFIGVHRGGDGLVSVLDGGKATLTITNVGRSFAGVGRVVIDGPGSLVRATIFHAGMFGTGSLEVLNGGQFVQEDTFLVGMLGVGSNNGGVGTVTVSGAGSVLSTRADLHVGVVRPLQPGDQSTATFRVVGGGPSITIGGKLTMGVAKAALAAVIDSSGLSPIQVASSAALRGELIVDVKGVSPELGQRFTVLTAAGGITGSLELAGPDADAFTLDVDENRLGLVYKVRPGDATGDGRVDFADLVVLAQGYGGPGDRSSGDFNHDDSVSFADLVVLAQNYGGSPSTAQVSQLGALSGAEVDRAFLQVPEPAAGWLVVGLGSVGSVVRCRRSR